MRIRERLVRDMACGVCAYTNERTRERQRLLLIEEHRINASEWEVDIDTRASTDRYLNTTHILTATRRSLSLSIDR